MAQKFDLKNFIEKEAEEKKIIGKINSETLECKDTQFTDEINKDNDSYGIPSDNNTENNSPSIASKEIENHRVILAKNINKDEEKIVQKIKRKRVVNNDKKDNMKKIVEHAKKTIQKIESSLEVLNWKLNIGFKENQENKDSNDNKPNDLEKTPEKKFKDEDDEEFNKLQLSNERRKIKKINEKNNIEFIKRLKDNKDFIKDNNITISDGNGIGKDNKRNHSYIGNKKNNLVSHRLKLYSFNGDFLKNKKK